MLILWCKLYEIRIEIDTSGDLEIQIIGYKVQY